MKVTIEHMDGEERQMQMKFFRHGYGNAWELNLIGNVWNLRVGGRQVALWRHLNPVFDVHR